MLRRGARGFSAGGRVAYFSGDSTMSKDSSDVYLRGVTLRSKFNDMPNLIFFPDMFDSVENWIPFFTHPQNRILDYRNVHILYPRNFGNSDYCAPRANDVEDLVGDVERFMYGNQISTATLAGHGFGARNAALVGCYKPHLVTGFLGLDYAPQDYRYFEVAHSIRAMIKKLEKIDMKNSSFASIREQIDKIDAAPKIKRQISQAVRKGAEGHVFNFNLPVIAEYFDKLIDWRMDFGLVTSRSFFAFPAYSNRVFLNTNTLSMHKICPTIRGFNHDVMAIQGGNDNPEDNHWIYENKQMMDEFTFQVVRFLAHFDGVNPLLWDRSEIASGVAIPTISYARKDKLSEHVSPAHFHHNYKFQAEEKSK